MPDAKFIQSIWNEQLFKPMGLRWVFRPETLDVFQEDEGKRAQALTQYVSAGFRLSLAAQILGVELPAGVDYDDLDAMKEEDKERAIERQREQFGGLPPQQQAQQQAASAAAMRADLERWERKCLSKGADCSFESDHIPETVMQRIRERLDGAEGEQQIKDIFAGKVRFIPRGADDALLPVPDEIEWTEEDQTRADARWDELMPQFRGMLGAEVVGQVDFDGDQY